MASLQLHDVTKRFGAETVIHGVDLVVNDHEFVVIVGPSGCGKSTLLRMIAGLESTDSGTIHIDATDVTDRAPVDRNVVMVFQSYALYPHMTVEENMSFGLRANGVAREIIRERVDAAAHSLQLAALMDRKPAALSGGQRQRVAIGRAIVRDPKIFLFDEPLSNLDAELRVHMRVEIARLHKRLRATMIYVTHDQIEAMTLADRIVVLNQGRIEQIGTPTALYDDPDNRFVAGFIGSPRMNFITAEIASVGDGSVTVTLPGFEGAAIDTAVSGQGLATGQPVMLGIRPEHVLHEAGSGSPITLECEVTERLGEITYIYARTAADGEIIIERRGERSIQDGDRLQIFVPREKALLFDNAGDRYR